MRLTEFFKKTVFSTNEAPESFSPQIRICSDKMAVIDGCRALNEYDENAICFGCDGINVRFRGEGLVISSLDSDISYVNGQIISVEFFNA